jgi:hypothetical protein
LSEGENYKIMENLSESTKEELLDCIQNLMGVFDTPLARLRMKGEFADEVRKIGRQILETNGRSNNTRIFY